jgi:glycosyltransferase involved in cell wall biosynthesis
MTTLETDAGRPLVSLCMATCLRSDLFPASFAGLLKQTYSPLEIVILVDGNNSESIDLIRRTNDPRVRWITTAQPSGMVPAWNRVVSAAHGKYFLFCADDDVLQEEAIDRQVALLECNHRVGLCHADFRFVDDDDRVLSTWRAIGGDYIRRGADEWPRFVVRTGCCMQTTVVRMDLWRQVGGWDVSSGNPGDNSLYLKLLRVADVGHISHVACHYRIRTHRPDSWEKQFANVREFIALARRHLTDPPPALQGSAPRLARRLSAHWSLSTLGMARVAPTRDARNQFIEWAETELWPYSVTGRLSRRCVTRRVEEPALTLLRASHWSKKTVKNVVLAARVARV